MFVFLLVFGRRNSPRAAHTRNPTASHRRFITPKPSDRREFSSLTTPHRSSISIEKLLRFAASQRPRLPTLEASIQHHFFHVLDPQLADHFFALAAAVRRD